MIITFSAFEYILEVIRYFPYQSELFQTLLWPMLGCQSQFQQNFTDLCVRYLLSLYNCAVTHTNLQERLSFPGGLVDLANLFSVYWIREYLNSVGRKGYQYLKDSGNSAQQRQDISLGPDPEGKK